MAAVTRPVPPVGRRAAVARTGRSWLPRFLLLSLLAMAPFPLSGAMAGQSEQRISARQASSPCVAVDIGGERAGHLDCVVQRLEEAARIARIEAGVARGASALDAGSPDVRVGVSSLSGTRLRMGGRIGGSLHPSRPIMTPVNPLGPR